MDNITIVRCPCCDNLISIDLVSGEISTDFINTNNQNRINKILSDFGYEFGVNGGDLDE